jgi:hypothetical protein
MSAMLSLSFAGLAVAQEDEDTFDFNQEEAAGPLCTTGSGCIGRYTTLQNCSPAGITACHSAAVTACGTHGGLSSYTCESCTNTPNPAYGCQGTGYFVHMTYFCNN